MININEILGVDFIKEITEIMEKDEYNDSNLSEHSMENGESLYLMTDFQKAVYQWNINMSKKHKEIIAKLVMDQNLADEERKKLCRKRDELGERITLSKDLVNVLVKDCYKLYGTDAKIHKGFTIFVKENGNNNGN
jgi:hypothetical protein